MGMLDGKVALVTGAASGIGAEIRQAGGQALFLHCDVSDADSVRETVEAGVREFGRLDIVLANAGVNGVWAPIDELQPEEWDQTLAINLRGTYLTVHFAVPHLKRAGGGSIIVTSSVNGTRTFSSPGASAYSTSKAGQVALTKMIALELGRHGIRCNAVCPGLIHTDIEERTEHRGTEKLGIEVKLPEGSPALNGGEGEPADVADTCLFLASDLSRHVSGVEIYVDGGASLLR